MLRQELLDSMSTLQGKFDSALSDAENYSDRFVSLTEDFKASASNLLQELSASVASDDGQSEEEVESSLVATLNQVQQSFIKLVNDWQSAVEKQSKSVEFRKQMQDSLLVYVYGKLKAGKSPLSNYIAWGSTNPDAEYQKKYEQANAKLVPQYVAFEHNAIKNGDAFNEAVKLRKFRVAATEATSTIQAFKLPGLTWVDSPGLHSTNKVNEELAKKYVANSDLILYLTTSASPARESDLKELLSLAQARKEMLILVSGSDLLYMDEDADGNIVQEYHMKPQATRDEQKEYVISSVNQVLTENNLAPLAQERFHNISAFYAERHPNEQDAIVDSGLSRLFTELHDIAQKDGVRLKQNAPLQNYLSFLNDCRSSDFAAIQQQLKLCLKRLEEQKFEVKREANLTRNRLIEHAKLSIDKIFDELRQYRDQDNEEENINRELPCLLNQAIQAISADISKEINRIISKVANNVAVQDIKLSTSLNGVSTFKAEMAVHQITHYESGSSGGWFSKIAGAVGGAIAGTFVGGPIGTIVGAGTGYAAGSKLGSKSGSISRDTITVKAGDNFSQIQNDLLLKCGNEVGVTFDTYCNKMISQVLEREEMQFKELDNCLRDLDQKLLGLIAEIKQRLDQN